MVTHAVDNHSLIRLAGPNYRRVAQGTAEAHEGDRRRRPRLRPVVGDGETDRQPFVDPRLPADEAELVDPVARLPAGGLEPIGEKVRKHLKGRQGHELRPNRTVNEVVLGRTLRALDPGRLQDEEHPRPYEEQG